MTETYEYWKNVVTTYGIKTIEYNVASGAMPTYFYDNSYYLINGYMVSKFKPFSKLNEFIRHRLDGPSVLYDYGQKWWFINDNPVAEYNIRAKKWSGSFYDWTVEQGMDIDNLTDEDKLMIKLVWS